MEVIIILGVLGFISWVVVASIEESNKRNIAVRNYQTKKTVKFETKMIIYGSQNSKHVALSRDNVVYIINQNSTGKIKINNIVNIKIDLCVREKNIMRVISIMPSYNKNILVDKISLIIMLSSGIIHEVYYIPENKNINTQEVQKKINEMEQFKSIMDSFENKESNDKNNIEFNSKKNISSKKMVEDIKAFKELLDCNIITQEEFDKRKSQIIRAFDNGEIIEIEQNINQSKSINLKKQPIKTAKIELKKDRSEFELLTRNAKNIKTIRGDKNKFISIINNELLYFEGYSDKIKIVDMKQVKKVRMTVMAKDELNGMPKDIYNNNLEKLYESNKKISCVQLIIELKGKEYKTYSIYHVPKVSSTIEKEMKDIINSFKEFESDIKKINKFRILSYS